jgi:hypothetical protein
MGMAETAVHSFVIRFVQEDAAVSLWHGFIRHVQSHEEAHFTQLQDAIQFMAQYVTVEQKGDETDGRSTG